MQEPNQRRILIFSGSASLEELQGLIAADILEVAGWDVRFGGGGIAADEVLEECGRQRPDVLLIFGANQQDAPNVRSIIDTVNTVGAHPNMKIVVGGGVFSRTQELTGVSLGEQIGAHAEINNPEDLVEGLEVFYGEDVAVKVAPKTIHRFAKDATDASAASVVVFLGVFSHANAGRRPRPDRATGRHPNRCRPLPASKRPG